MELLEQDLGFLLTDVSRLMRMAFQKKLKASLITLPQARALLCISRHEGVCQVDLAKLLKVRPMTLVTLLDELTEGGFVQRRPNPADRRVRQIYLTPNAVSKLAAIRRAAKAVHADVLRDLGNREAVAALSVLRKMHENLALQQ